MDVRLLTLALLVAGLAGCTSAPAPPVAEEPDAAQGVLRGVVLDAAVVPIPDVEVTLVGEDWTVRTDVEGRFAFTSLTPGAYFLAFSKPGFSPLQQSASVTGPTGTTLKVQLDRLPGTLPFAVAMQWDGFMACSWFVVFAFATGCLVGDHIQDDSRTFEMIDARPHWLQSEITWENTQPAGENLCMRHYASSGIGGDLLADDVCGPSPQTMQVGPEKLEETGLGNTRGLERVVWVDFWLAEGTAGVAIDQDFTVFTHRFHNLVPDPDWRFLDDGPYPV